MGSAETTCPSRIERSVCPSFDGFHRAVSRNVNPPESFTPCWLAVTTVCPLGNCDSLRLETSLRLLDSAQSGFSSLLAAGFPFRMTDRVRPLSEEPVNSASSIRTEARAFEVCTVFDCLIVVLLFIIIIFCSSFVFM
jgi:hypothetical protein